jgi:hypothetical protein
MEPNYNLRQLALDLLRLYDEKKTLEFEVERLKETNEWLNQMNTKFRKEIDEMENQNVTS